MLYDVDDLSRADILPVSILVAVVIIWAYIVILGFRS